MPRYFFDIHDGDDVVLDDTGSDLDDLDAAKGQVMSILPQVALEMLPDRRHREMQAVLRDEAGSALFKATLTFRCASLR